MNSEAIILGVQVIAALGVVVSVVYLGVQIRQQTSSQKRSSDIISRKGCMSGTSRLQKTLNLRSFCLVTGIQRI